MPCVYLPGPAPAVTVANSTALNCPLLLNVTTSVVYAQLLLIFSALETE